jgi:hypothetical protein
VAKHPHYAQNPSGRANRRRKLVTSPVYDIYFSDIYFTTSISVDSGVHKRQTAQGIWSLHPRQVTFCSSLVSCSRSWVLGPFLGQFHSVESIVNGGAGLAVDLGPNKTEVLCDSKNRKNQERKPCSARKA